MLSSGGEAVNSLAINTTGDLKSFVKLMNDKANAIRMIDTHFINPGGLHHKHQYTTVYDMSLLVEYAFKNGYFEVIFTKNISETSATLDQPDGIKLRSTVLAA